MTEGLDPFDICNVADSIFVLGIAALRLGASELNSFLTCEAFYLFVVVVVRRHAGL